MKPGLRRYLTAAAMVAAVVTTTQMTGAVAAPARDIGDPTIETQGHPAPSDVVKSAKRPGSPTWITIDDAGVNAPVVTTRQRSGELSIPNNIRLTGWDRSTALAGARMGTTLIAGHLDDSTHADGALRWIGTLHRGDVITVKTTRSLVTYRVATVRSYRQLGLPESVVNPIGWHRLALVTCGGPLVRGRDGLYHYRDNVVVSAKPIR